MDPMRERTVGLRLEDAMKALGEQNALLTVNQVPDDVLIAIFSRDAMRKHKGTSESGTRTKDRA